MTDEERLLELLWEQFRHKRLCESCRTQPVYLWPAECREQQDEWAEEMQRLTARLQLSWLQLRDRCHRAVEMQAMAGVA